MIQGLPPPWLVHVYPGFVPAILWNPGKVLEFCPGKREWFGRSWKVLEIWKFKGNFSDTKKELCNNCTLIYPCLVQTFVSSSQMQKGNDVLKKAKSKSEQIEKKGDKVQYGTCTSATTIFINVFYQNNNNYSPPLNRTTLLLPSTL